MIASLLPALIELIGKTVDRAVLNKDEAEKLKNELTLAALQLDSQALASATSIIVAEAKSDSWLTSNWRPLIMLVIIIIIANNYILYPYISLFWKDAPLLDLPDHMWQTIKIGLGGYTVGRSAEKVMHHYSGKPTTGKRNIIGLRD